MDFWKYFRRALLLGPKGPTVAAEGCSPPQELEKAARRAEIYLVNLKFQIFSVSLLPSVWRWTVRYKVAINSQTWPLCLVYFETQPSFYPMMSLFCTFQLDSPLCFVTLMGYFQEEIRSSLYFSGMSPQWSLVQPVCALRTTLLVWCRVLTSL